MSIYWWENHNMKSETFYDYDNAYRDAVSFARVFDGEQENLYPISIFADHDYEDGVRRMMQIVAQKKQRKNNQPYYHQFLKAS